MAELIAALDVQTRAEAVEKVKLIGDAVSFYKIGLELYTAEGPDVVKAVKDLGKRIFLDLKFHDIPRTVERAVRSGGKLGVDLMTIHSVGGKAMIAAAHEAAAEFGAAAPKILAVTVLTSLDQSDLADIGVAGRTPAEQVKAMASSGEGDGLVCRRERRGWSRLLAEGGGRVVADAQGGDALHHAGGASCRCGRRRPEARGDAGGCRAGRRDASRGGAPHPWRGGSRCGRPLHPYGNGRVLSFQFPV